VALGDGVAVAVRSSAPAEDSSGTSFAGLHDSLLDVSGAEEVVHAVRLVWASLWSDAALLYRRELGLDPLASRMAVVVQRMVAESRSGVAFGCDPREPAADRAVVEAVPGSCRNLVDGLIDPQRWLLQRSSGAVLEWRAGEGEGGTSDRLLDDGDLQALWRALRAVEELFGWLPDVEWTGRQDRFTLLQARPVTTANDAPNDDRARFLRLRPRLQSLRALAEEVSTRLIPELEREGTRFAGQALEEFDDHQLAAAITQRRESLRRWRDTYAEKFIPFAHGVRALGIYYNDAVRAHDAYEFVGLLRGQEMLATRRNEELRRLATRLANNTALQESLQAAIRAPSGGVADASLASLLASADGGAEFAAQFEELCSGYMDVAYAGERLSQRPLLLAQTLLELAKHPHAPAPPPGPTSSELEERLLRAVGPARREEAEQILAIGRLSWRLRDDDNLLMGRLESQLLRALSIASERLRVAGRLREANPVEEHAPLLATALTQPDATLLQLPNAQQPDAKAECADRGNARQLVGQPAAPGLATGMARTIRSADDLGRFRAGEVLVCDAIQPAMTHLVPLAAAVVERRGGMLIHGAIIARELGIPCVNGIADVTNAIPSGEIVSVDGELGLVTVGPPSFDIELGARDAAIGS
jgi:pyruvate,water dikinase